MDVIAGGVLERFPRLRVGFFESGLGWLPYWLKRLDEHHEIMGEQTPWLRRRPSDIFRAQCCVSMEGDERSGLEQCSELGLAGCVLWGSDYPHFDAKYPGAYAEAAETFEAVGGGVAQKILEQNPRRFYGLA
jgi:predicted TIM-barrel fold metal-dependent hydrolase